VNFHLLLNRCHCDYRCIFCTMGSEAHRAEQETILADFDWDAERDRIDRVLVDASRRPGVDALHIMGNDPCNQPDLLGVIERARALGFRRIVLETNALKLADRDFARELVNRGVQSFKIPVYGSSAEVHDGIVRLPGAFRRLQRAFDNLRDLPVDVRLHALMLRQNVDDLTQCRFPFPLSFRFPFAHDRADFAYEDYAPRLRDVPSTVLALSDLVIPCVTGQLARQLPREERARPEAPTERDHDANVVVVRPSCCSRSICRQFDRCRGIYRCYLRTYGDDEFRYRSRWAASRAIGLARATVQLTRKPSSAKSWRRAGIRPAALLAIDRLRRWERR
jgi:uncharacterized Fe-S cluster-containing radical SAM superfamily protein